MEGELHSKLSQTQSGQEQFVIHLTNPQYIFLQHQLPKNYSLQIDNNKHKRQSLKRQKKDQLDQQAIKVGIAHTTQITKMNSSPQIVVVDNMCEKIVERDLDLNNKEQLNFCVKMIKQLKTHKTSWAFRQPVDPIKIGIPNYLEVIREPMDLQTVQNNLNKNLYATSTQFHADINKIIRNSYLFNQNNPTFVKITSDFQKYYFSLLSTPKTNPEVVPNKNQKKPIQQTKLQNELQFPTLAQKKQLSQHIRRLNKEDLKGVVQIVYAGKTERKETFDIEDLDQLKIRQLQKYVRTKLTFNQKTQKSKHDIQLHQVKIHDESSFIMDDSDS